MLAKTDKVWSPQQENLFKFVEKQTGSAVAIAVAGGGKTTALVEACNRAKNNRVNGRVPSIRFAAFNKSIAIELQNRISSDIAEVKTAHAFGLNIWSKQCPGGKVKIDAGAKWKAIEEKLTTPWHLRSFVKKAVSLAKKRAIGVITPTISDKKDWLKIVYKWDLDLELSKATNEPEYQYMTVEQILDIALDYAINSLQLSIELSREVIDFDDMVYMPLQAGCKVWQSDYLFVDEAQDTNPMLHCLYRLMLAPGGRLFAVGDPAQAIYGFTGADNDALDIIKHEFNCVEIPLTITYRCPKAVVRACHRAGFKQIQAAETAPEGQEIDLDSYDDFITLAKSFSIADVILCRKTAPLVDTAYTFMAKGIPCHVEGRDIGEGLLNLIGRWKRIKTLSTLSEKLAEWADKQIAKYTAAGRESAAESIADKVETINVMIEALPGGSTVEDLKAQIGQMFSDGTKTVTLSTVHKAKGREWETVYILGRFEYMPSKYARQDWQVEQEHHLIYVAMTRSKDVLVNVPAPPPKEKKSQ